MTQLETTLQTITPINDYYKKQSLKTIELYINEYNQTKSINDFKRVYDFIGDINGYEVELNMALDQEDKGKYMAHYEYNLYDPDTNEYIKTYELERAIELV